MKTTQNYMLLLCLILCTNSIVTAQSSYTEVYPNKKIAIENESLDIRLYDNKYNSRGILDDYSTKEDGTQVRISCHRKGTNIEVTEKPPYPYIYTLYKEFYPDGKLKQKGILMPKQVKVGNWIELTKNGDIQTINYEIGRSNFGYNDILKFLDQVGYLKDQPNGENWMYSFWYSPQTQQWGVRLSKGYVLYERYIFDGTKGELAKKEAFEVGNKDLISY